jgi:hypothetical protein
MDNLQLVIIEIMFFVVKQCIFNQTQGYWLLALMLNLCFKSFEVVKTFVGRATMI